jgi:hypothetical protein
MKNNDRRNIEKWNKSKKQTHLTKKFKPNHSHLKTSINSNASNPNHHHHVSYTIGGLAVTYRDLVNFEALNYKIPKDLSIEVRYRNLDRVVEDNILYALCQNIDINSRYELIMKEYIDGHFNNFDERFRTSLFEMFIVKPRASKYYRYGLWFRDIIQKKWDARCLKWELSRKPVDEQPKVKKFKI